MLRNIHEIYRNRLIAEIVKYYIVKNMYGYQYEFRFTGMTIGNISADDIISIDEIKNYVQMQEKYSAYSGFYDKSEI